MKATLLPLSAISCDLTRTPLASWLVLRPCVALLRAQYREMFNSAYDLPDGECNIRLWSVRRSLVAMRGVESRNEHGGAGGPWIATALRASR